ncbi:MAG TPA: PEP-CTERM sorting domain-containing protein [Verrucomicrobiae bacterium]|nr:PEP-CTERM sorting domain-containing protein [Verrucomicrobiae bacterium]
MKLLTKPAVWAAGVSLIAAGAQAFTANDIYLGFSQSGAAGDYLIDLGQVSAIGVGGSTVVDLSSSVSLSQFNSTFVSGPNGVSVGAVGGESAFPSSYSIFATTLRITGPGNPAVAGSDLSSASHSQSVISSAVSDLTQVAFPTAGNGTVDAGKTWASHVLTLGPGSFYGDSGINPSSTMDASGVVYQDLWGATPSGAYTYLGYFSLDLGGSEASLTFTPTAAPVPEPSGMALFGLGAVVCLFTLRNHNHNRRRGDYV